MYFSEAQMLRVRPLTFEVLSWLWHWRIICIRNDIYSITRRAVHMHQKLVASACEFATWAPACECAKNHLEVLSLSHALLTSLQAISVRTSNSWLSFKSFASADNRWFERCFLFPFHNITNWQRCLAFPLRISQFSVCQSASKLPCLRFQSDYCTVKLKNCKQASVKTWNFSILRSKIRVCAKVGIQFKIKLQNFRIQMFANV